MKVFLLHRDRDVDLQSPLPANEHDLANDLELATMFAAMAGGDGYLADVARRVVFTSLTEPDEIVYRQHVLADCIAHPAVVRQLYDIVLDALRAPRKVWFSIGLRDSPGTILRRSLQLLELLTDNLRQLRRIADDYAEGFRSAGFVRFFAMIADELDEEYIDSVVEQLAELEMPRGVLSSAELGQGNKGVGYVLHRPPRLPWWARLAAREGPAFGFQIHPRDEAGGRALTELEGRGVNLVANALAQSADHVLAFFQMLRAELAFYLGCLNLHERLEVKGLPVCFPDPRPPGRPVLSARELYDVCLALTLDGNPVGNAVDADGRLLVMITGANQGGKSTFLRSLGLAQLLMQSGMFVPAEAMRANVCRGVFTHFKREEDDTMTHGKLDEELARMSEIADLLGPDCVLLCNESFASTNEREGSEIARQVVRAATESGVKVGFVTHLYDLAHSLYEQRPPTALFLRAERGPDGHRTYLLAEGEPRPTSYGEDSYRRIFGTPADTTPRPGDAVSPG